MAKNLEPTNTGGGWCCNLRMAHKQCHRMLTRTNSRTEKLTPRNTTASQVLLTRSARHDQLRFARPSVEDTMTLGMAGDMDDQAMTANLHNFEVQLNAEDSRIQVLQAAQAEFGSSFAAISAVATPPPRGFHLGGHWNDRDGIGGCLSVDGSSRLLLTRCLLIGVCIALGPMPSYWCLH